MSAIEKREILLLVAKSGFRWWQALAAVIVDASHTCSSALIGKPWRTLLVNTFRTLDLEPLPATNAYLAGQ